MSTRTTKKAPAKTSSRAIPTKSANKVRAAYLAEVGTDRYRNQYNAGWDARHRWTRCRQGCLRHRHGGFDRRVDRPHRPPRQGRHRV